MKNLFQLNDRVFDIKFGWGVVKDTNYTDIYPIKVQYSEDNYYAYTKEGKVNVNSHLLMLSFTEYDFVKGGFSQERPKPTLKQDTLVYIQFVGSKVWHIRYFSHFDENYLWFYIDQKNSKDANYKMDKANDWSLTNPLTEGISKKIKK